jgi:Cytidylyltransferase-like
MLLLLLSLLKPSSSRAFAIPSHNCPAASQRTLVLRSVLALQPRNLTSRTSVSFRPVLASARHLTQGSHHIARARPSPAIRSCQQRRTTKLQAVLGEAGSMDAYRFNDSRLKKNMDDPSKTPLLLVACGSFSPITFLHLRMFVMAGDYTKHNTEYEVIGGYLSPVSDAYKKQGLAGAEHR